MNATIRDKTVLESIRPLEAATYLRSVGWSTVREQSGHFSVWEKLVEGDEGMEVVLPLDASYRDYALRISDLLGTLQLAERRSQTEIYSDIQTTSADVIRVRYRRSETEDGTVALDQGVSLLENASELMLASACATLEPRGYYTASKQIARDYVRQLRLGQSEVGSYVLRILSPVAPRLQAVQGHLFREPETPFERRVSMNLIRSLSALRATADDAVSSGKIEGFQQAVQQGVSANLCSALVNMAGRARTANDSLAVSISWARSRPMGNSPPSEVVFPGDRFPIIEEAARWFKAIAPREDVEVRGAVVRLQRKGETGPAEGPVTLLCFIEGEPRRVSVSLAAEDHRIALRAYEEGATISCTGDLVRTGNLFTLLNQRRFTIVPEEEVENDG